jgi:hypothetical protein
MTVLDQNKRPKGTIHYVFMIVSLPEQPIMSQTSAFLLEILPELEKQATATTKIGFKWVTESLDNVEMSSLIIDAFGGSVMNNDTYSYRTMHLKLKEGEAKCIVVYDKL